MWIRRWGSMGARTLKPQCFQGQRPPITRSGWRTSHQHQRVLSGQHDSEPSEISQPRRDILVSLRPFYSPMSFNFMLDAIVTGFKCRACSPGTRRRLAQDFQTAQPRKAIKRWRQHDKTKEETRNPNGALNLCFAEQTFVCLKTSILSCPLTEPLGQVPYGMGLLPDRQLVVFRSQLAFSPLVRHCDSDIAPPVSNTLHYSPMC